jgi:hypothetical protein
MSPLAVLLNDDSSMPRSSHKQGIVFMWFHVRFERRTIPFVEFGHFVAVKTVDLVLEIVHA